MNATTTEYFFQVGQRKDAMRLARHLHYSGTHSPLPIYAGTMHEPGGLMREGGRAVAACLLCSSAGKWRGRVLEMSRSVAAKGVPPEVLVRLIERTCGVAEDDGRYSLIVAYEDHTKERRRETLMAAGFTFGCRRKRSMDGCVVDGEFVPGRSCNQRWGTRSPSKLRERLGPGHSVRSHLDAGKNFFWLAFDKDGRQIAHDLKMENEG